MPTTYPKDAVNVYMCQVCKETMFTLNLDEGVAGTVEICKMKPGCPGVPLDCAWPPAIQTEQYRVLCKWGWQQAVPPGPTMVLVPIVK